MDKKENGYIYSSYPQKVIKSNMNYYLNAYYSLINEWTNDFYTPYSLLKKIETDFSYVLPNTLTLIEYKYADILKIINDDYKYYEEFYNALKNKDIFAIRICLFQKSKIQIVQKLLDDIYIPNEVDKMLDSFISTNSASINFNDNNINRGCLILIDIDRINIYDEYEFEKTLDHELNHYFKNIEPNNFEVIPNKNALNIVKKYAKICEYDFNGSDFIIHMFNDEEFIPMCTDVCNCLEKFNISYYQFLELVRTNFLSSSDFLNLNTDLQNNLFFSFCCRVISPARWTRLKRAIRKQFNILGWNIFKNIKNYFIDKKLQK